MPGNRFALAHKDAYGALVKKKNEEEFQSTEFIG